tara:strand:- start:839 stop:1198 length:360 start_codon:yes stop_codon:yes gene_type:complete
MENLKTLQTNFKTKEKQLRELLGDYFENTTIKLIQKSKVKDIYHNVGDIVSMNEHYLHHLFELIQRPMEIDGFGDGYIDGWKIPFEDYEMKLIDWMGEMDDKIEIEKTISNILGCKIYV